MLSYINIAFKYDWWLYCEIKAHKYIDDFMKHILLAIKKLSTVYGKKYRRTIFLLLLYAACGVISSIGTVVCFARRWKFALEQEGIFTVLLPCFRPMLAIDF